MSHSKREPRSPYARYGKRPFTYSGYYQNWRAATSEEDRMEADRKFRVAFAIPERQAGNGSGFAIGEDE